MLTIMDEERILLVVVDSVLDILECEGAHTVVTVCRWVNIEVPKTIEEKGKHKISRISKFCLHIRL